MNTFKDKEFQEIDDLIYEFNSEKLDKFKIFANKMHLLR